ncbi:MAG: 23S rRNA pseudouridine(1911/1915/1917) synthase RluD [Betaproteobacteria bacterium]|nr:23S rRNA pseudouridine(1911/1915/1917) synthase RluD [Betaproteobacteria bacterium]
MSTTGNSPKNYSPNAPATPPTVSAVVPAAYAGHRSDYALAQMFPEHSRSRLCAWLKAGRITLNGLSPAPKDKVRGGETVLLTPQPDPQVSAFRAQDIPIDVLFEDQHLIIINKPAGLVVHPGSGNWQGTLLNALLQHAPQLAHIPRAGIVHRLDKDTSGLLVVAKTLAAQTALVRQLQAHSVTREYIAVVHGLVAREGHVQAPIGRHKTQRTKMAVVPGGKPALTHYEPVAHFESTTQVRCRLKTGRTHQIRVHMAHIGHPLVGDAVYGGNRKPPAFARQALHAHTLQLQHPATRRRRAWSAALPADMQTLIATLKNT